MADITPLAPVTPVSQPDLEPVASVTQPTDTPSVEPQEGIVVEISPSAYEKLVAERVEQRTEADLEQAEFNQYLIELNQNIFIQAAQRYAQLGPVSIPVEHRYGIEVYETIQRVISEPDAISPAKGEHPLGASDVFRQLLGEQA
ncbi:hypothetical protein [uncultured Neptuniibacter sp.]|uniref:hypothetical protein n=1 Tax=uncultured Neptuniibacter sp. TaxID=502143 RepID=UPI002606E3FC|nr:hypothetical protein [uncultured Neptuniibacter sp.]